MASTTTRAKQIAYLKSTSDGSLAKLKGFVAIKRQVPLVVHECVQLLVTDCLKCSTRAELARAVAGCGSRCWTRVVEELATEDPERASYSRGERTVVDVVAVGASSMDASDIICIKLDDYSVEHHRISHINVLAKFVTCALQYLSAYADSRISTARREVVSWGDPAAASRVCGEVLAQRCTLQMCDRDSPGQAQLHVDSKFEESVKMCISHKADLWLDSVRNE